HLADIDGDSDLDVIGSSGTAQLFAWWENLDGLGTFSNEKVIETDLFISDNFPVDVDGDGDMDVFTLSPGFLRWYENTDGLGAFGDPNLISDNIHSAISLAVADIDNNTTADPVTALQNGKKVVWFENNLLSIPEDVFPKFVLFPNPVGDTLQIQATVQPDK